MTTFMVYSSACGTLSLPPSGVTQASFEEPIAENDSRININAAEARELEKLPGVGKVIAERIIAHRTQYGPFRRAEHLMMVRGISDRKYRALRVLITTH
jgi:competence protein ComEA